jgi:hypothetical protein
MALALANSLEVYRHTDDVISFTQPENNYVPTSYMTLSNGRNNCSGSSMKFKDSPTVSK